MSAYSNSIVYKFPEGDANLVRVPYQYTPSSEDKIYEVIEGDRLDTLAFKFYRDSKLWYIIADSNDLINPFVLELGQSLVIPKIR